jgi:hypothetical protein
MLDLGLDGTLSSRLLGMGPREKVWEKGPVRKGGVRAGTVEDMVVRGAMAASMVVPVDTSGRVLTMLGGDLEGKRRTRGSAALVGVTQALPKVGEPVVTLWWFQLAVKF